MTLLYHWAQLHRVSFQTYPVVWVAGRWRGKKADLLQWLDEQSVPVVSPEELRVQLRQRTKSTVSYSTDRTGSSPTVIPVVPRESPEDLESWVPTPGIVSEVERPGRRLPDVWPHYSRLRQSEQCELQRLQRENQRLRQELDAAQHRQREWEREREV